MSERWDGHKVEIVYDPLSTVEYNRLVIEGLDVVLSIDPEDGPRISEHQWLFKAYNRTVVSYEAGKFIPLARLIMFAQPGQIVRRRDGDWRNFRKANLVVGGSSRHLSVGATEPAA
jgi:hypothetical protein